MKKIRILCHEKQLDGSFKPIFEAVPFEILENDELIEIKIITRVRERVTGEEAAQEFIAMQRGNHD